VTFAPVVSMTDHILVTPDTATLGLTTYAPTVTGSEPTGGAGGRRGPPIPVPNDDDLILELVTFPSY
jgi:hypothetical protein